MFRQLIMASVFVAAILVLAQPGLAQGNPPVPNPADAKLLEGNPWVERIQKRGMLKVGFDIFRPWVIQTKDASYIGFEIQVAQALAADLGVKLELFPTVWDGIIPALLTGRLDIIIGGLGITEERAKRVSFTEPYAFTGMALAASRTSAPGLSSLEDFNKEEITIAVKSGTTAAIAAKKTFPGATIVEFDDEGQILQETKSGRAHTFVAAIPYPAEQALKSPEELYIPLAGTFTKEPCGMALAPKNKDALPALNAWIKARFESKWLTETWSYWFETLDWQEQLN